MLLVGKRNQACFAPFLESVALPADVDGGGVMQQAIEDGCGDDRIPEDGSPFAVAFVRCQNDAASFVAGADQLKEDRRAEIDRFVLTRFTGVLTTATFSEGFSTIRN